MRLDIPTLKKIGARIRRVRTARLIKQEILGKEVNLSKSEISRIENGKRQTTLATLLRIAKAIGIKAAVILED